MKNLSDLLKHVLISEVIGEGIYKIKSIRKLHVIYTAAFGLGFTSHAIMDLLDPDYVVNWFNFSNLRPVIFYVGIQLIFTLLLLKHIFSEGNKSPVKIKIKLFAIAGGILPDIIDGFYSLINPAAWYNGNLLFFFHRSHGHTYIMSMGATLAISLSLYFIRIYFIPIIYSHTKKSRPQGARK